MCVGNKSCVYSVVPCMCCMVFALGCLMQNCARTGLKYNLSQISISGKNSEKVKFQVNNNLEFSNFHREYLYHHEKDSYKIRKKVIWGILWFCEKLMKMSQKIALNSAIWPFKVIQGQMFKCQMKRHMWLPICVT